MKYLLNILVFALVLSSCQNETQTFESDTTDIHTETEFDWSSSASGLLEINMINPNKLDIEGEFVSVLNKDKALVGKVRISDGVASIEYFGPQKVELYLHFASTGDIQRVNDLAPQDFTLRNAFKTSTQQSNKTASCTITPNNFDFEAPYIGNNTYKIKSASSIPGWNTTASDGKIELWSNGFNGVASVEGDQFCELNASAQEFHAVYQELELTPGQTYKWSIYHRGRGGVDQADVLIGADLNSATTVENMVDGNTAWGYYTGTYTVPAGQSKTYFIFQAISVATSSKTVGNFIDAFKVECDGDGDGVEDAEDAFPNDPTKAFKVKYPTVGRQIMGFEDLWPFKGDYDFNDLMAAQSGYMVRNANWELVEADMKVSIDAIGAGEHNGIGILWRDLSNDSIQSDLIASVTGATTESVNRNGLVLSQDIFSSISSFYQNNGQGPSKTPDTLSYHVDFVSGQTMEIYPELYLFKTDDRTREIHKRGVEPTMAFDKSRLGTHDDNGDFATTDGLPWAVEILVDDMYQPSREHVDMSIAYPEFYVWANSGGTQNVTWYNSPLSDKVFDLSQL